jgi:hypothetical protein
MKHDRKVPSNSSMVLLLLEDPWTQCNSMPCSSLELSTRLGNLFQPDKTSLRPLSPEPWHAALIIMHKSSAGQSRKCPLRSKTASFSMALRLAFVLLIPG